MQSFRQYRQLGHKIDQQLRSHRGNKDLEEGGASPEQDDSQDRARQQTQDHIGVQQPPDSQKDPREGRRSSHTSSRSRADDSSDEEAEEAEQREPSTESLHAIPTKSDRSIGTRLAQTLTGLTVRPRLTKDGGEWGELMFVVGYQGQEDMMNPHNWSHWKRWYATSIVALIGFVVGAASSIDASVVSNAAREFGVSQVVESLATGLFLVGFGVGSLFAGPVSETIGRNPVYVGTLSLFMVFVMASGLAPNIGAQLAFRFIAALFASTPLTCAGGSMADLWNPLERFYAFPVFSNSAFMGPVIAPVIGGYIAQSSIVGWRWVEWTTLIVSGGVLALVTCFLPETHTPTLLRWKASHLRRLTGEKRYVAPIEIRDESFTARLRTNLYRPFRLTATEPIVILVALYLTIIYIILFTFLDGYELIFAEIHGTSPGTTGLCFLGIAIGLCVSTAFVPLLYGWAKRDLSSLKERSGDPNAKLPPEYRLWYTMIGGCIAIPVSLFWMAWTSDPDISIWSPLVASVFFGYGMLSLFISAYQYIIDSYEDYAASALSSITFIRYLAAGGMVVAGYPFYRNMGVHYTVTILACLSAVMAPVPYIFYAYGERIRSKSKYATSMESP